MGRFSSPPLNPEHRKRLLEALASLEQGTALLSHVENMEEETLARLRYAETQRELGRQVRLLKARLEPRSVWQLERLERTRCTVKVYNERCG